MNNQADRLQLIRTKFLAGDIPRGLVVQEIAHVIYGDSPDWPQMDAAMSYPPNCKEMLGNWIAERGI